jgi:hypothetical protein
MWNCLDHRRWLLITILTMATAAMFVSDIGRAGLLEFPECDQVVDECEEHDDHPLAVQSPLLIPDLRQLDRVDISGPDRFSLVNSWRVHSERGPPYYHI